MCNSMKQKKGIVFFRMLKCFFFFTVFTHFKRINSESSTHSFIRRLKFCRQKKTMILVLLVIYLNMQKRTTVQVQKKDSMYFQNDKLATFNGKYVHNAKRINLQKERAKIDVFNSDLIVQVFVSEKEKKNNSAIMLDRVEQTSTL